MYYYRQTINLTTGQWYKLKVSTDVTRGFSNKIWRELRKKGKKVIGDNTLYAINKIERWHKRRRHRIYRQELVKGIHKQIRLTVMKS